MRKLAILAFVTLCPIAAFAGPQTITLRDGRTISGTFVSGNANTIIFRDDNGVRRRFTFSEIQAIDFGQGNYLGSSTGTGAYPNQYPDRADRVQRNTGLGETRILPAGSDIVVRTNEAIQSETATEGRTYSAVISRDVVDNSGALVIPRGSDAQLVVRDISGGGATGSRNLALDLQSVTANGRRYIVSTQDVEQSNERGLGANRRTATMVGGGAALGTLLGAIAGGGKGAAIGAIAGAAAGAGAQVLTRGKSVNVPAETELTFRLDQPVRLEAR